MTLMIKQTVLVACALGLTWFADCGGHDDPPTDPPPEEPPPPPPPPPMSVNAPGDAYDPAQHRVLLADCANDALMNLDLATGERSVFIDTWPWPEPGSTSCVTDLVVEQDGERAYAIVNRGFDTEDEERCTASEFISIDTATSEVTVIQNIYYNCCPDCPDVPIFREPQVDAFHERLIYIEADCSSEDCFYALSARPFGADQGELLFDFYPLECSPEDDWACFPTAMTFDPEAPDDRILVLVESDDDVFRVDAIELATGTITETIPVQTTWDDLTLYFDIGFSVDVENQRVLVTMLGRLPDGSLRRVVIAIDRATGAQALLYDGRPTPDGETLACATKAAFDTQVGRLLLIESSTGPVCQGRTFAVDADTGAFTRL